MGASASVCAMPIEERRDLYNELRGKYTRSDLDDLAEEEKQAWLEVVEERKEAEAAAEVAAAEAAVVAEVVAGGTAEVAQDIGAEGEPGRTLAVASGGGGESPAPAGPEVSALDAAEAAEAAAARTGASNGRKSGWDLSGKDDAGVRPQERKTRLSYLVDYDNKDAQGIGVGGELGAGEQQVGSAEAADVVVAGRRRPTCTIQGTTELPAWKKTAEEVETPNELCVGDVVRVRDKDCHGMWFEGVLTQIHDENTFEVELAGEDDEEEGEEGGAQRLMVGIADLVRVMPWFCIEVGDMVECQPDGMCWVRGTVVNIDLSQALYDVALESDYDDDCFDEQVAGRENGGEVTNVSGDRKGDDCLTTVPETRIRKIISGRQAAAKRWKKVVLASHLTGLGRWISSKAE